MPRGNPAVWNHHGPSFFDLTSKSGTGPSTSQPSTSGPANTYASIRAAPAAGAPSTLKPRGAGSFVHQTEWSLAPTPAAQGAKPAAPKATEIRSQYKPPPEDYKRRAPLRTDKSSFPVPNYPHEFKTVTQADFHADPMKEPGFVRTTAVKHKDSGRLLPTDPVPPQYTTQAVADFSSTRGGPQETAMRAAPRAGNPATKNAGYNIITGGPHAIGNNVFERWDGRDYRRHR
mmetsp:Transcript_6762/g.16836  ORF Transcript_6762/g.16836 Transcript_6762/m.16836 type:complete len:230 (-) Transcript_6762:419-1108(-)